MKNMNYISPNIQKTLLCDSVWWISTGVNLTNFFTWKTWLRYIFRSPAFIFIPWTLLIVEINLLRFLSQLTKIIETPWIYHSSSIKCKNMMRSWSNRNDPILKFNYFRLRILFCNSTQFRSLWAPTIDIARSW